MTDHPIPPDFETLLDWIEGRLPAESASLVTEQVAAGDARVTAAVSWLEGFMHTAQEMPLQAPPPILRQRLRQTFAAWTRTNAAEAEGAVEEVHPTLIFDSRRDLHTVGTRGVELDEVVHLGFTAPVADLVIDVHRSLDNDRLRLGGQVLLAEGTTAPIFEAEGRFGDVTIRDLDGDELGRFSLDGVPPGVGELRVTNGMIRLNVMLDLTVGEP